MSRTARWGTLIITALCAVVVTGVFVGCETAEGLSGLQLVLTPGNVFLTPASNTVEITVSTNTRGRLSLPIEWSVTNPDLGTINSLGGYSAIYRRSALAGENTVIARDQYKDEGFSLIRQIAAQYELTVVVAIDENDEKLWTITVSGGVQPYAWWLNDQTAGTLIQADGSPTVVYAQGSNVFNVINVRDANGVVGSALVSPAPAELEVTVVQADEDTWTITVDGGDAPYQWWVAVPQLGEIVSEGNGASAVYEVKDTDSSDSNIIFVRDAGEVEAQVFVPPQ